MKSIRICWLILLWIGAALNALAAVTFRAASSAVATSSTGTTVTLRGIGSASSFKGSGTVSLPSGTAAGDLLLLLVATKASATGTPSVTSPSGWQAVGTNSNPSAGLFWKIAGSSESSVGVSSPNDDTYGRIVGFYNVNASAPFDTAYWGISSSNDYCQANAVNSTDGTGSMDVFTGHGFDGYGNSPSTPSGFTQRFGGQDANAWLAFYTRAVTATGSQAAIPTTYMGDNKGLKCYSGRLVIRPSVPGGNGPTLALNVPSGTVANDVMIATIAYANSSVTITPPNGWTLIRRMQQTSGREVTGMNLGVYYRVAGASEPADYTWTLSASGYAYAVGGISSFTGADLTTASPIDVESGQAAGNGSAYTFSTPSLTPTENASMLLSSHAFLNSDTWTPPTGFTEDLEVKSPTTANASGISLEMNHMLQGSKAAVTATATAHNAYTADYGATHLLVLKPGLDHIQLEHGSGTGLTCAPSALTVRACLDSGCTSYYTRGVSGSLTASGAPTVNWDGSSGGAAGSGFVISPGQSFVTKNLQVTTAGTVVFGVAATPSPTPASTATCNFAGCSFSSATSGFLFSIPNHVADVSQTVSVSAVKQADNSLACVPAWANVTKSLTFKCSYTNPSNGTLPVRVGGNALNASNSASAACDTGGRAVSLAFNGSGVASTSFQYADVGNVNVTATYTGSSGLESGLSMSGSDDFITAPKSFAFSNTTAAPIKAGANFTTTVSALNNSNVATPNFGKESAPEGVTLTFTKYQPAGSGSNTGTLNSSVGSFAGGSASATLSWSEVGTIDLAATLTSGNYLGSGQSATGTTGTSGAVGRFIPDHFDTTITHGCNSGGFTYSGQPFGVQITARNAAGTTTRNYDGTANTSPNFAKAVILSDSNSVAGGSWSGTSVVASAFSAGVASATPTFTFTRTTPDKAPANVKPHASDTDGAASVPADEATTQVRIGRMRLANAFGSEKAKLTMPVLVQYWDGSYWLPNTNDSCTSVPATAVALSNYVDYKGSAASWTTSVYSTTAALAGAGSIVFNAPSGTSPIGSVDVAFNLGSSAADTSCLTGTHPATTGAGTAYLRGNNGACTAAINFIADPAARASFGVYSGESGKAVHIREIY